MKSVKELYPSYKDGDYGPCDYQPMVEEIGEIIHQVDDNDYQGDTRVFFKKGNMYGFLIFGWGSCSGCDALQGADSFEDIQKIYDGMVSETKWFNSLEDMQLYFNKKDWELEYSYHYKETREFIDFVKSYKQNAN